MPHRLAQPMEYVAVEDVPKYGIERGDLVFIDIRARYPLTVMKRHGRGALAEIIRCRGALRPAPDPEAPRAPERDDTAPAISRGPLRLL